MGAERNRRNQPQGRGTHWRRPQTGVPSGRAGTGIPCRLRVKELACGRGHSRAKLKGQSTGNNALPALSLTIKILSDISLSREPLRMRTSIIVLFVLLVFSNTSAAQSSQKHTRTSSDFVRAPGDAFAALQKIDPERIRAHVRFLSHDLLEGRGTGQRGGDIAAEYIATEFALYGLKPAGDDGTYFQNVPMVSVKTLPATSFKLVPNSGDAVTLKNLDDFVTNNES